MVDFSRTPRDAHEAERRNEVATRWLDELTRAGQDGRPASDADRVAAFRRFAEAGRLVTSEPILPLILNLDNRPLTLKDHFHFSPLFRTKMPEEVILTAGRQVGKSISLAASGVVISNSVPGFNTLFVTPLYEQIRRFSNNYVRPLIDMSPVKALWSDTTTENSVLQRSFKNRSKMVFTFAFLNADRVRGLPADRVAIDELQDMQTEHIDIIRETMSASEWAMSLYTGTPKTLDAAVETYFRDSSQAEWFVPCYSCTTGGRPTLNIPSVEFHLLKMIGPYRDDISDLRPGVICHKCGKPVNPRFGRWVHRYPERRWRFAGYHVPQPIMPIHYARPNKWATLLGKMEHQPPNIFHNEILGESYDTGSKLVTLTELKAAACLDWENVPDDPDPRVMGRLRGYIRLVLGIDWGGGGKKGVSFTKLALLGIRGDGRIDCLWGKKLLMPHAHIAEAEEVLSWVRKFNPHIVAHDYSGAGDLRHTFLVQAGVPISQIMSIRYVGSAAHSLISYVPGTPEHQREYYSVDKSRSLLYTTNCLKHDFLRFFRYDYRNKDRPGLLHDFLALVDEKVETHSTAGIYVIKRQEGFSDDFAHAVNVGCVALWHSTDMWPDYAAMVGHARMTPDQLLAAVGPSFDETAESTMAGYFMTP